MDQLVLLLPPAVIIGVMLFTNNLTNKRIDDLRDQMKNNHQNLAIHLTRVEDHLTRVENKLDNHITNYGIHKMKGD